MATLASDLAAALDPVVLCRQAGLEPDSWQVDVLRSTAPRLLLNCSRQSGKSTATSLMALYAALYQAPSLILLLSPSLRQSVELFKIVSDLYECLGEPVPPEAQSALRLELRGGSRIVALPGREATVRGFGKVALLIIDEASRIDDALWTATAPMVGVSAGRIVMLSTPWGRRGIFHDLWMNGEGWQRVEVPATACKRLSTSFLAEMAASMPRWQFNQEFLCQFEDNEISVFSSDDIEAALVEGEPLWA